MTMHRISLWNRRINRGSIKEALDTLPAGICYFTENGLVKLCNLQMYRLFRTMTQSDLQSRQELQAALRECADTGGVLCVSREREVYLFPDGKAWRYSEAKVQTENGRTYTESVFSDVTELYERRLEIEAQTKKLRKMAHNLRQLSQNVAAVTREEEIHSFKSRLHDRLGAGIVAARQVLLQNRPSAEMDQVIELWKQSVALIQQDNEAAPERDDLAELFRDAETIGVRIRMEGALPPAREDIELFLHALRESLTNCVRHAGGTEITAKILRRDGRLMLSITNNGAIPRGEIVPGGGLGDLRRQAEARGGTVKIESSPVFRLTVLLPERKENAT